jgi:hypothetical protein
VSPSIIASSKSKINIEVLNKIRTISEFRKRSEVFAFCIIGLIVVVIHHVNALSEIDDANVIDENPFFYDWANWWYLIDQLDMYLEQMSDFWVHGHEVRMA